MDPYVAEFIGTMILVLIGDGVCANASLTGAKGNATSTWVQISLGWAVAVYVAVICTNGHGAHLNPAVSIGFAMAGKFSWSSVGPYIISQLAGAFVGAALVFFFYVQHFAVTDDKNAKLGTFCTIPAIRSFGHNLFSEALGTFILVFAGLVSVKATISMAGAEHAVGLGDLGALPVAMVVFALGIGLGGTTGYGINPARDLGPRIAHAVLPIPNKRDSDWSYSWVPVLGPILGGLAAAALYLIAAAPSVATIAP